MDTPNHAAVAAKSTIDGLRPGINFQTTPAKHIRPRQPIAAPYASTAAAWRPRIVLLIPAFCFFCPFVLLNERRTRRKYGGKSEKQPANDRAEVLREKAGQGCNSASKQESRSIFVPFCSSKCGKIDRDAHEITSGTPTSLRMRRQTKLLAHRPRKPWHANETSSSGG